MVYEFPELRGVIGREYAKANGEHERVARALHEQYLPAFVGDVLPKDVIGAIIGVADRIDNIVSCGKMDLLPTGSQDPYALRRTARCLNELIIGLEMDVDLGSLVEKAAVILKCEENIGQKVMDFLKQRLYVQLREKGFSHDVATLSLAVIGQRPLQALKLAEKLESVRNEEWFQRLATAAVRVRNILAKASALDTGKGKVDESYFQSEVEKELYHKISVITPVLRDALKSFDWDRIISSLLELEPIISRFFEEVLVMADDPLLRMNRLALLAECDALFRLIGDLGTIRE
jgi:glycyl-tRNA synthetase beta chain